MDYGRGGMYHSMGGRGGMDYMPPPPPPPRAPGTALDDHLLGPANCHSKSVGSLGWSSGGGLRLATGSDDKTCRIYDVDPGSGSVRPLLKLDAHTDAVVRVAWDPSAPHRLATLGGDRDRTLRLWDVRAGVTAGLSVKLGQEYLNLAWSPDGGFLGCGSASLSGDKGAPGDAKDFMSLVDVRKGSGKAKVLKFPYQVEECDRGGWDNVERMSSRVGGGQQHLARGSRLGTKLPPTPHALCMSPPAPPRHFASGGRVLLQPERPFHDRNDGARHG